MNKRIICRVPDLLYEQINEGVKNGKAKTPSELIRTALSEFFQKNCMETSMHE